MRFVPTILIIIALSCSSGIGVRENTAPLDQKAFKDLLLLCEKDLKTASNVITNKDMIASLSHLQFMASGGTKYYILEKKNITKVLQSVTEGIYSDFILINSKGTIVYTKSNNDIFSKNVRTSLKGSPFYTSFKNTKNLHFEGLSPFPDNSRKYYLFASIKIKGDNLSSGYFILQLGGNNVTKFFSKRTTAVDTKGTIRISRDLRTISAQFIGYNAIKEKLKDLNKRTSILIPSGKKITISRFNHRNIDWFLISE